MLPGKAIPATMLFLLFVRSGVTTTTTISSVDSATPLVTPSANDGGGSQGGVTPSPTATPAGTQTVTASVSVPDVVWSKWITEDPSKCKEKCCDSGRGSIHQIRYCTIVRPRCDLNECENYGVTRREVSCKTACDCMSNAGHLVPGLKTIIATLLICTLIVNMKP